MSTVVNRSIDSQSHAQDKKKFIANIIDNMSKCVNLVENFSNVFYKTYRMNRKYVLDANLAYSNSKTNRSSFFSMCTMCVHTSKCLIYTTHAHTTKSTHYQDTEARARPTGENESKELNMENRKFLMF